MLHKKSNFNPFLARSYTFSACELVRERINPYFDINCSRDQGPQTVRVELDA
jgi:hypothetical protein